MSRYPIREFSNKERRQILALRSINVTFDRIAKKYGVSPSYIHKQLKIWLQEESNEL